MNITHMTTDAEIEAEMQRLVNDQWPPAKREKAMRLGGALLVELNTFFDGMTQVKAGMIADRDAAVAALPVADAQPLQEVQP